ncbi:UDP-N-acetylmuramoyl-L-alanyl-D-glutamate--2,6-diaminopimelate ligase [Hyphococcus sp.]|uniref:UDP-N-acetylmuramoyl-L-alanyl-D-glutamate--2, 6-diaminopimelate ligase n=1 Tax=Hyphococcus sp. TaxID=2038636 RepID=UPI003CCB87AD
MKLSVLSGEPFSPDPVIAGMTADSRAVDHGFLFAALPGVNMDGAAFIPQAEERGAAAILARPGVKSKLPIIADIEPRRRLAQMASRFYPRQPETIAGITGTNGKTSTARFAAQLWSRLGRASGSLGTLGAQGAGYERKLIHTTPDPVTLHETLQGMADAGVNYLAMEVSSHGLAQHRADGVKFKIAAFTNITQDHLDYHASFDDYFAAKARLFDELLADGGVVVVNADGEGAERVIHAAKKRKIRVLTTGANGEDVKLLSCEAHATGLRIEVDACGHHYTADTHLIGDFQAENALLAAGIVIASGARPGAVMPWLSTIEGAPGRMQHVASLGPSDQSRSVFVDYAHTPDAVATALQAIRPHAKGRVIAIIGAGGDRDKAKRSLMGAAAQENADVVIVTDDNPRTEDPAAIRKQVMEGSPDAMEIADRGEAIGAGVAMLEAGDVLLILGKGHETGQVVGDKTLPFDDAQVASRALANRIREIGR